MQVESSRLPLRRKAWARLTADALAFYEQCPTGPPTTVPVNNSWPFKRPASGRHTKPTEVVLLSWVSSLLGKSKGSDRIRLIGPRGHWWEIRTDAQQELEAWVEACAARLQYFRTARRLSQTYINRSSRSMMQALQAVRINSAKRRLAALCRPCWYSFQEGGAFSPVGSSYTPYRGSLDARGQLVDLECLSLVSDPDEQEAQAAHWSEPAVRYLQRCERIPEDLMMDFQLSLRMGVPDGLKRLIWPLAAGAGIGREIKKSTKVDPNSFYANITTRAFGNSLPRTFQDPVPTFCQGVQGVEDLPALNTVVSHLWLLTRDGEHALRRLLWVTQLTCHSAEFCPFLPNLFAVLLVFFDESETMFIVSQLLREAENDQNHDTSQNPRIILNLVLLHKQAKILVKEGRRRGHIPEALDHLERLGIDVHAAATRLLQDGLARALTFRCFCRMVGSFLAEGSEAVLRYALALIKVQTPKILACKDKAEAERLWPMLGRDMGDGPDAVDGLTKAAYSLALTGISLARVSTEWSTSYLIPKKEFRPHIFCRPRLFEPRGNCPDELWEALWCYVPPSCRIFDPRLIYVPSEHGTSLRTCLENCKKYKDSPMVFFLYNRHGDIIGGFSPVMWARTVGYLDPTSVQRAVEDSFVFRRCSGGRPAEIYCWTGENQLLFQASDNNGLIFGADGAAISIHKDLLRASTTASKTFSSPLLIEVDDDEESPRGQPLKSAGGADSKDFELLRLEIFALV